MAFLASRASFSTTFLTHCGRGESLVAATCPKIVFVGKQGFAPCRILAPTKPLFVSVEFYGDCHKAEV